jgi:hypothetical protein
MLVSIFYEPTRVFRALKEKPTWLIPLVVFLLAMTVMTYFIMPAVQKSQLQLIEKSEVYTAEQKAQIKEQMTTNKGFALIGVISAPIVWAIGTFIAVGLIMLMCNVILGGKAGFAQVYGVVVLSLMTWVISSFIKTPLIMAKDSIDVRTSLAILLPGETTSGPLYTLLNSFTDVFVIWQLILLIIGVKVIYDFTTQKASLAVLIPVGVIAAITVGLSAAFS